jgi:hypothetical protein
METLLGHAVQAVILSVAAVEAAINLAMALPVTELKPAASRPYFDEIVRMAFRSGIRKRLNFLAKHKSGFELTKDELKGINRLLDLRNEVVHANPEFKEYPAKPPHTKGLSDDFVESLDGTLSVYSMGGSGYEMIWKAVDGYKAAEAFLNQIE